MSLKFEISLSFPQVQMLLAFVNMEKEGKVVSGKQVRKATVATAIALVSEGLVTHKKAKVIGTPGEWKVTRVACAQPATVRPARGGECLERAVREVERSCEVPVREPGTHSGREERALFRLVENPRA